MGGGNGRGWRVDEMVGGILLIVAVVVFRLVSAWAAVDGGGGWMLANFSPLGALVFCGGLFLPGRWAWILPGVAVLVTDMVLNVYYGLAPVAPETLGTVLAWGLVFGLAWWMRPRLAGVGVPGGTAFVVGGALVSSLIFYVVTNTVAFAGSAFYAPTPGGWVQAMTVGVPGYPPTWMFLRNAVVGDVVFTLLFLVCVRPFGRDEEAVDEVPRMARRRAIS